MSTKTIIDLIVVKQCGLSSKPADSINEAIEKEGIRPEDIINISNLTSSAGSGNIYAIPDFIYIYYRKKIEVKERWEVQLKGKIRGDEPYELSVIRNDNEDRKISWGCGGEDKIIVFSSSIGGNKLAHGGVKKEAWARNIAQLLCDALNKEGI
jgi:hypothetical protein